MIIGFIIWTVCALILIGIGLYTRKMKKPAAFFTYETEGPEVDDVSLYNRDVSKLWISTGILFEIIGLPLLFLKQNAWQFVFLIPAVVFLMLSLIIRYLNIKDRHAKKK